MRTLLYKEKDFAARKDDMPDDVVDPINRKFLAVMPILLRR